MGSRIRKRVWFQTRVERTGESDIRMLDSLWSIWQKWAEQRKTPTRFMQAVLLYDALLNGDPSRLLQEFPWVKVVGAPAPKLVSRPIEAKQVIAPKAVLQANVEDAFGDMMSDF